MQESRYQASTETVNHFLPITFFSTSFPSFFLNLKSKRRSRGLHLSPICSLKQLLQSIHRRAIPGLQDKGHLYTWKSNSLSKFCMPLHPGYWHILIHSRLLKKRNIFQGLDLLLPNGTRTANVCLLAVLSLAHDIFTSATLHNVHCKSRSRTNLQIQVQLTVKQKAYQISQSLAHQVTHEQKCLFLEQARS